MLGRAAAHVPRAVDGAADVLLVHPAVEDADGEEVEHRARPGRRHPLLREVGLVAGPQRLQPEVGQLLQLGQDLGAGLLPPDLAPPAR